MNDTINYGEILFESKGMPSKMRNLLLVMGIFLTLIAIVGTVRIMTLPRRTAFNTGIKTNTEMIDGNVVTKISSTPGITDEARNKSILFFGGVFVIGVACLSCVIAGRKFYFHIYKNQIEGRSGFGFLSKSINIPIQQIGELSSNKQGLMPSLLIRTIHGNNVPIFMNANKVSQAEGILRHVINSQLE